MFDPARKEMGFRSALTAKLEVPDLKKELSRSQRVYMPEQAKYAYCATAQALKNAGIDQDYLDTHEVGIMYGNDKLNEIGRVQITTAKTLFFDAYSKNKATGSFILIDPITNNTSAVGMIIGPTAVTDIEHEDIPELNLPKLGIAPEHYDAIEKAVKDLSRQGIAINIIK